MPSSNVSPTIVSVFSNIQSALSISHWISRRVNVQPLTLDDNIALITLITPHIYFLSKKAVELLLYTNRTVLNYCLDVYGVVV